MREVQARLEPAEKWIIEGWGFLNLPTSINRYEYNNKLDLFKRIPVNTG